MTTPSPMLMLPVLIGAALLAGCGGSSPTSSGTAPTRAAASGPCPDDSNYAQVFLTIDNRLDTDVSLAVPDTSWSCEGFSGRFTPAQVNGTTVAAGTASTSAPMHETAQRAREASYLLVIGVNGGSIPLELSAYRNVSGPLFYPGQVKVDGTWRCSMSRTFNADAGGLVRVTTPASNCSDTSDAFTLVLSREQPS